MRWLVLVCLVMACAAPAWSQAADPRWLITLADGWRYPADTLEGISGYYLVGEYEGKPQWLPIDSIEYLEKTGPDQAVGATLFAVAGAAAGLAVPRLKDDDGSYLIPTADGRMMMTVVMPVVGAAAGLVVAGLLMEDRFIDLRGHTVHEARRILEDLLESENRPAAGAFPP